MEEKPLYEHLNELRKRILLCLAVVIIFSVIAYFFQDALLSILILPYGHKLLFLSPSEAFFTLIALSLAAGFLTAFPIIVFQAWKFLSVAVEEKNGKSAVLYIFFSLLLFYGALVFCYFLILPVVLDFLTGFGSEHLVPSLTFSSYLYFVLSLLLGFGIIFQFPLVLLVLIDFRIVSVAFLKSKRRHSIVIIFIIAALLPTVDAFSQIVMALPMLILFEITLWIGSLKEKIRKKQDQKQMAG